MASKGIDHILVSSLYIVNRLSAAKIGQILGYDASTVCKCLKSMGIARSLSEAKQVPGYFNKGCFTSDRFPHRTKCGGYIYIWTTEHPKRTRIQKNGGGYISEHQLVWEKVNGKLLPEGFVIHHLNGIKDDNREENLVAMEKGEHIHQTNQYSRRIKELEDELSKMRNRYEPNLPT